MATITKNQLKILLYAAGVQGVEDMTDAELQTAFNDTITETKRQVIRRRASMLFNEKLNNGDFDSIANPTNVLVS